MKNNLATEKTKRYLSYFPNESILSDKDQRELITRWLSNKDKAALNKLVYSNRKIVVKQAYKFANGYADIEDLIQCGMIGMIKAIGHFDPTREVKFTSYAMYWINAELINYFKKETIHNFRSKKRVREENLPLPKIENPNNLLEHSSSFEQELIEKDYRSKTVETVKNAYACLSEREANAIDEYYFNNEGVKNCSYEKIAKNINVSKQMVSNIISKASNKLKNKVGENKNIKEFLES